MRAAFALLVLGLCGACTSVAPVTRPEASTVRVDGEVVSANGGPGNGALLANWLRWREASGPRALERLAALHPERALALHEGSNGGPLDAELRSFFGSGTGRRWVQFQGALEQARAVSGAEGTWWHAVQLGYGTSDPSGLLEALELRPAASPWPSNQEPASAAALFVHVAELHLLRSEPAEALVAARRAAIDADHASIRDGAMLVEARALLALGSRSAALACADELGSTGSEGPRRKALALAGAVHAQGGELAQAESLLRRALDGQVHWAGAGRARADLALVLLASGRAQEGAAELTRAKAALTAERDPVALVRLLTSEAAWHRHVGATDQAEHCLAEARALVRDEGLPIAL